MTSEVLDRVVGLLPRVAKPARYIGSELHLIRKEPGKTDFRLVLSYPDAYEVGMSNLALRVLYDAVNSAPGLSCERVFAPWPDFEKVLREEGIPLYSLETYTPLSRFDAIGFSLGCELLATNVLNILDLGGVPLLAERRGKGSPIVLAGGPAALNPEPFADFVDVFVMGDGESALLEILRALVPLKGGSRGEMLAELARFDFAYVPSLYAKIGRGGYLCTDVGRKVKRRIEPDLDALPCPQRPLVPLTRVVQDRVSVEVARGCATGCRFCQAGFVYRPVRERSLEKVLETVEANLAGTGYDEVSLVSLNIGEYSELDRLVRLIHERFGPSNVSVSLPSLKVNSVNLRVLEMIQRVRKSGLTFAVESADPVERIALNKPVDQAQLEAIVREVERLGWRLVKLYFMIGLPGAADEGGKIADFVHGLARAAPRLSFNVNVSVFVPKPHTPFERADQLDAGRAEETLSCLRKAFGRSRSKVRIKFQNPGMSAVEGFLARGDRKAGEVILEAFREGERFSAWDELFDYGKWQRAWARCDVDPRRYLSLERSLDPLPWSFVDTGVAHRFIVGEGERAAEGTPTPDCLNNPCSGCGVCDDEIGNKRAADSGAKSENAGARTLSAAAGEAGTPAAVQTPAAGASRGTSGPGQPVAHKMLFQFTKLGLYRFISHLDLLYLLSRVAKMCGLPFDYTKGFNPKPRLTIPFPLVLGVESEYELGELFLTRPVEPDGFVKTLNAELGEGLGIVKAALTGERKSVAARPCIQVYRVAARGGSPLDLERHLSNLTRSGGGEASFNPLGDDSFTLRLKGNASIRSVLEASLGSRASWDIRRTMVLADTGGEGEDFFRKFFTFNGV